MKKMLLAATVSFVLVCISGFTIHQPAPAGKQFKKSTIRSNGPAWISSPVGYLHNCDYVEHYSVADGEPGDTYEWYWDLADPYWPDIYYLGDGPSTDIQLGVGDRLILKVNSVYYGEYEYWDTAIQCEE